MCQFHNFPLCLCNTGEMCASGTELHPIPKIKAMASTRPNHPETAKVRTFPSGAQLSNMTVGWLEEPLHFSEARIHILMSKLAPGDSRDRQRKIVDIQEVRPKSATENSGFHLQSGPGPMSLSSKPGRHSTGPRRAETKVSWL